jgi:hypothetical protein
MLLFSAALSTGTILILCTSRNGVPVRSVHIPAPARLLNETVMLMKASIKNHAFCGSLKSVVDITFRLKVEGPEVRISVREIFCSPKKFKSNCGALPVSNSISKGFFSGAMDAGAL